ncbi:hypothetical protein VNO78_28607 [Psophocarpus tetragonolobus]|uniref:Transmembrane protein n=1 Tax=Psophocarpus tetragonolobus TaxID=3891 RepID=A0AAN9RTH5_PSOTE
MAIDPCTVTQHRGKSKVKGEEDKLDVVVTSKPEISDNRDPFLRRRIKATSSTGSTYSATSISMALSDTLLSNLTLLYVAVIACIKAYAFLCGRSFGGAFVLLASTAVVALILLATLTWDVSRKATHAFAADHPPPPPHTHDACKGGGICWHGVAVRSPASQVRFRLPQNLPYTTF